MCGGCVKGYYARHVGIKTCLQCTAADPNAFIAAMLVPVLILLGVFFALFLFAVAASYIAMKRSGGTMEGGMLRVQGFMVYLFMSMSLMSQVSRVCVGKVPEYMNALAAQLALFQLDVVGPVSPDCTDEPFLRQIILFYGSVICMAALGISMLQCLRKSALCRKRVRKLGYFRQFLLTWLCLTYSLMVNFVFEALYCTKNTNGEYVMGSNPLVFCYVGKHATLFTSAVFALVFHGILFPVCSALIIFHVRKRHLRDNDDEAMAEFDKRPMWKYFLSADYHPHMFWFRHVELALFFMTAICNAILVHEDAHAYLAGYVTALMLTIGLYCAKRPFTSDNGWMLHVRNYLSVCSILYVLTNYCSSPVSFDGNGEQHVVWLAPIAMGSTVLLLAVLMAAFVAVLLQGAKKENLDILNEEKRAIDSAAASMFRPNESAVLNPMMGDKYEFPNPKVPPNAEVEMVPVEKDPTIGDFDVVAREEEDATESWTEHYDPATESLYYECERTSTTWAKRSALGDGTTVVEHIDPSSSEVYFEYRQRRVTWTRPQHLGDAQLDTSDTSELALARRNLAKLGQGAKPPEGIKHTTVWWQLLDGEGRTCYLNRLTKEVKYQQPPGWVRHLARERFGGISRAASRDENK